MAHESRRQLSQKQVHCLQSAVQQCTIFMVCLSIARLHCHQLWDHRLISEILNQQQTVHSPELWLFPTHFQIWTESDLKSFQGRNAANWPTMNQKIDVVTIVFIAFSTWSTGKKNSTLHSWHIDSWSGYFTLRYVIHHLPLSNFS